MEFDFSYHDDIVLAGNGGVSQKLIEEVGRVLETTFGFKNLEVLINDDVNNIAPFSDSEPRQKEHRDGIKKYDGKHVFFLQYLKIFDNRLRDATRNITKRVSELNIEDDQLIKLVEELGTYALPDEQHKVAARFTPSRFNPAALEKQLSGQITAAKMGHSLHVSVVAPMTIFEWSHHYAEKWHNDQMYEMPAWQDFLFHIGNAGADSVIILHPHAPKEGLQITSLRHINMVMIYPQTFTLNSNGWIYSTDNFLRDFDLSGDDFDPIRAKMKKDKLLLGDRQDISHLLMFSSSVDKGSRINAQNAAMRFGLGYIASEKNRKEEGVSEIKESDYIGSHLKRLEVEYGITDAAIRIYIFDDMVNTCGTANDEAKLRKQQVAAHNEEHNTNYQAVVELVATHLRCHEIDKLKCDYLDKLTFFDTVPYLPPLEKQLENFGMSEKFEILHNTPHQLALGIALDYFAQRIHRQMEINPLTANYRNVTDEFLIKKTPFGKDLDNMMRELEKDMPLNQLNI